jgi:hypothetical protein
MKFVKGDILDAKHGIMGHQVNCRMVMGAVIAKQIRNKYPRVYTEYIEVMGAAPLDKRLGKCQLVQVDNDLYVANLFGQFDYIPRGIVHTDYNALSMALNGLSQWHKINFRSIEEMPIYLPLGLGCGLAGGNWKVVEGLISSAIPDATIVRYDK